MTVASTLELTPFALWQVAVCLCQHFIYQPVVPRYVPKPGRFTVPWGCPLVGNRELQVRLYAKYMLDITSGQSQHRKIYRKYYKLSCCNDFVICYLVMLFKNYAVSTFSNNKLKDKSQRQKQNKKQKTWKSIFNEK